MVVASSVKPFKIRTINDLACKDLDGVVERQNRTLVEATQTMLIYLKCLMFLWAEVVATAYAPSTSHSPTSSEVQPPISHQGVAAGPTIKDDPFGQAEDNLFINVFTPEPNSKESLSGMRQGYDVTSFFPGRLEAYASKVLSGNYSSTKQVNSIQHLFAYCLLTRTKVDIGEIIYSDLVTMLTNKSRQKSSPTILSNSNFSKDPSKATPIELTAFMVAVNNRENSVTPLLFTVKKKKGNSQTPTDRGLPSMVSNEGTVKTTSYPKGPRGDKDLEGLIPPADMEPLTNPVADPLGTEIDDEEVFVAGEDIDEDNQADEEEHQLTRGDLLNALNGVTETLKAIQDAVKEDTSLKKKVVEATEAYLKNSTHLTELFTLIKKFNFQRLKSSMESLQATALSQDKHLAEWAKLSTSIAWNIGPRMTAVENSQAIIRTKVSSLSQDTSDIKSMMT
nr:hypothetical protein [Tanacetum cinerariifolium]